tara:strand:- start:460 stop:645 length:186 start_codon:yes stop_codon:yes gene_type:complete
MERFKQALADYKRDPSGRNKLMVYLISFELLKKGVNAHLPLSTVAPKPTTYRRVSGNWVAR